MIGLLSCSCIWSSIFLWSSWVWFSNSRNVWWFLQGLLWCISQTDTKRKRIWGKAPALFIVSSFKSLVSNLLSDNCALDVPSFGFSMFRYLFCFFFPLQTISKYLIMKNKVCKVWKWNMKKIRHYKYKEQEWYLTQSLTTLKKH